MAAQNGGAFQYQEVRTRRPRAGRGGSGLGLAAEIPLMTVLIIFGISMGGVVALEEVPFATLDPAAINQVVIMYRAGESASDAALAAVEGAEAIVAASGEAGKGITFRKCDAAIQANGDAMVAKGLDKFPMVFVSVEGQGMDRYMRDIDAGKLSEFVLTKLEPTTDEDVFPYSEDLISDTYPVFVKFYEQWCSRCLAMKKAFEGAASKLVGQVMFMEIECSSSEEAGAFCNKHAVDGYPTMKLIGGSLKAPIEFDRDRSVQGMMEFLEMHVPVVPEDAAAGDGATQAKAEL